MGGDSRLHELLQNAERFLVQNEYFKAEQVSRKALQSAGQLTDSSDRLTLGDRAAAVLLQALFETNRFSSAKPCLISAFGSMAAAPPTTLLLWLSLALDTDEACQAQNLMLNLLQTGTSSTAKSGTTNTSSTTSWTRRQYLALLHLYVVEVLLPALRDPSEVCLWLQRQHFLPLDPRERHFLESEVDAAAAEMDGGAGNRLLDRTTHAGNQRGTRQGGGQTGGGQGGKATLDALDGRRNSNDESEATGQQRQRRRVDYSYTPPPGNYPPGAPHGGPSHLLNNDDNESSVHSAGGMAAAAMAMAGRGPDLGFSPVPSPLPFGPSETTSPQPTARGYFRDTAALARGASTSMDTNANQKQDDDDDEEEEEDGLELDWLGKCQQIAFDAVSNLYSAAWGLVYHQTATQTNNHDNTLQNSAFSNRKSKNNSGSGSGGVSSSPTSRNTAANSSSSGTSWSSPAPPPQRSFPSINNGKSSSTTLFDSGTLVAAAAAGVCFAYAAYVERDTLKKGAQSFWRGVGRGMTDLLGTGMAFGLNPMATNTPNSR